MSEPCKTCGHDKTAHIYHEGACRPGFVCSCEQYVEVGSQKMPTGPKESEVYHRMVGVLQKRLQLVASGEDFELHHEPVNGLQVLISRTSDMHDPLSAIVIWQGVVEDTCWNSKGLYVVLGRIFDTIDEGSA